MKAIYPPVSYPPALPPPPSNRPAETSDRRVRIEVTTPAGVAVTVDYPVRKGERDDVAIALAIGKLIQTFLPEIEEAIRQGIDMWKIITDIMDRKEP